MRERERNKRSGNTKIILWQVVPVNVGFLVSNTELCTCRIIDEQKKRPTILERHALSDSLPSCVIIM